MFCHHKFHVELSRCIYAFFICTCIKSTTINCFPKSVKSSEHDVQNTCSKDPIGVSICLLNLECTVIKIQAKHYKWFPVWTNDNCRYILCQRQYSTHVYRVVMSLGEVLNSGAITSVFVRAILSCVFYSNSEQVAAQMGIPFCLANRLLSSAFTETDMIDLFVHCVS